MRRVQYSGILKAKKNSSGKVVSLNKAIGHFSIQTLLHLPVPLTSNHYTNDSNCLRSERFLVWFQEPLWGWWKNLPAVACTKGAAESSVSQADNEAWTGCIIFWKCIRYFMLNFLLFLSVQGLSLKHTLNMCLWGCWVASQHLVEKLILSGCD